MPKYVKQTLEKLQHPIPTKDQHAPHRWIPKTYGKTTHLMQPPDTSQHLTSDETTHIQQIVGSFLYYARAVDNTIFPVINKISINQAKLTQSTKDETTILLAH